MRLNPRAFEKTLKTDGSVTRFWHYTNSITPPEFDAITQVPVNPGALREVYADVLDFTVQEIKNYGGLVDEKSKKFIVMTDVDINKGDEMVDDCLGEQYKIVFTNIYANRLHLFANKVENGTDHS